MADTPAPDRAAQAAQLAQNFSLEKAPGADLDLDALFPNPDMVAQQPVEPPVQSTPQAEEPFLKLDTGTLYKTKDEAIRGYTEKDRYISQLRQQLDEAKAKLPQQPAPPQADAADQLYDQLAAAAGKGDKKAYIGALDNAVRAVLQPYAPLLSEVAREKAIRTAETRTPGVREFVGSEAFNQVTERVPLLKQALEQLSHDPMAAQAQLDQLFELAKLAADGIKAPDLAAQAAQQAQVRAQSPTRPTLQPSTPTPTPTTTQGNFRTREEMLQSPEGRKAYIEQYKDRIGQTRFDQVGL